MAAAEILRDHSDSAILIASEDSLMTFWQRIVDASSIYRGEDMQRVYTGLSHPLLNSVYCPRFGEQSAEKQVSKVIDFFRTRGVPHSWWIGASSTPERLGAILIGKGLVKSEWEQPAMAVDLRTLDHSRLQEISNRSGVVVSQVETESDLDLWMGIFSDIYTGFSVQSMDAFHSVLRTRLGEGEAADLINFIAKIDGEPVGVSMILLGAGVAGLYNVGTLKEHERKGIGSAVSLMALLYGRKRGYETGVLQSSAPGLNVYTRLGFKEYFKWQVYSGDGGS